MEGVKTAQILPENIRLKDRPRMGVGLRNLWVRPDVHVVADEAADQTNRLRRATLKLDGLLCGL